MGQPHLVLGERDGKEGMGGMGWAHRKGGEPGRARGTQRALHSARGQRRILALCGCWMASRSSTNTPLWLWKGLLCRAPDPLDTPSTQTEPALKVNTPVLDWIWKTFMGCEHGFHPHLLFHVSWHHTRAVLRRDNLPQCLWGEAKQFHVCFLHYHHLRL